MEPVHGNTDAGLVRRGLIEWAKDFPTSAASLTEKGQELADD